MQQKMRMWHNEGLNTVRITNLLELPCASLFYNQQGFFLACVALALWYVGTATELRSYSHSPPPTPSPCFISFPGVLSLGTILRCVYVFMCAYICWLLSLTEDHVIIKHHSEGEGHNGICLFECILWLLSDCPHSQTRFNSKPTWTRHAVHNHTSNLSCGFV